jgi:predicted NAD-dependent protein-ADP-ribosyltransferase YbiA (DUF1768 family)
MWCSVLSHVIEKLIKWNSTTRVETCFTNFREHILAHSGPNYSSLYKFYMCNKKAIEPQSKYTINYRKNNV